MRTLVIDTASAACSVALIDGDALIDARHEVVGRGHAERLVPMIAELADGGRAERIVVDCGPGSFTGIRVGIAAARALAIGWGVPASGYTSTALLAAIADADHDATAIAVVIEGGHGEVFMQGYAAFPLAATDALVSLPPAAALAALAGRIAVGSGVRHIGTGIDLLPRASAARLLPAGFTTLPPRPIYGRAPDAKPAEGAAMSTMLRIVELTAGDARDVATVDTLMRAAFDPRFGEGWTQGQCLGVLALPGVWLTLAHVDALPAGFALIRAIAGEAELLLIATAPKARRRGVGAALLRAAIGEARARDAARLHLEVRASNTAIALYQRHGFAKVGERRNYYRGNDGRLHDAHTYAIAL